MELGIKVKQQGAFIQWGMEEAMLQLYPPPVCSGTWGNGAGVGFWHSFCVF